MQSEPTTNGAPSQRPEPATSDVRPPAAGLTAQQPGAPVGNGKPVVEIIPNFPLPLCLKPHNDREDREEAEMSRLTASIEKHGVLQTVTGVAETIHSVEYARIVDGWSRTLASRRAGRTTIPLRLYRRPLTATEMLVLTITGNLSRTTTSHKDQLTWLCRLAELNPGWTQVEIARAIDFSPAEVSRMFRISKRLPSDLQEKIGTKQGMLPPRGAYALTKVTDAAQLREYAIRVMEGTLKVEALELLVAKQKGGQAKAGSKPVKATLDGVTFQFAGDMTWDRFLELASRLAEAVKKGAKMDLPPAVILPSLLKH